MMDTLRTVGPWESEQTHDSLRRFLLEETYELFDAMRGGSADELREELGDVLLQVLFHARIAEDATARPFSIDDVAETLVRKLKNRVPAVLAGQEISLDEQLAQWEARKALEKTLKPRHSIMDDIPTAQPALALAQKVIQRAANAGVPPDLLPDAITAFSVVPDVDAENTLRAAVLEFIDTVRDTEKAIAAHRHGNDAAGGQLGAASLGTINEQEWRTHWPSAESHRAGGDVMPSASESLASAHAAIRVFWEQEAAQYDDSAAHGIFSDTEHRLWRTALSVIPPASRVLDVGTGTGFVAQLLAELGHQVTAVDASQAMLAIGRAKAREHSVDITFEHALTERLPFDDATFDAVTARHFIWTLLEPERAFAEWRRVLAPGGMLVADCSLDPQVAAHHYNDEVVAALPFRGITDPAPVVDVLRSGGFTRVDADVVRGDEYARAVLHAHVGKATLTT
jgi:XTP/dITP diphosphohydrolase